jgi:hypothetical protein
MMIIEMYERISGAFIISLMRVIKPAKPVGAPTSLCCHDKEYFSRRNDNSETLLDNENTGIQSIAYQLNQVHDHVNMMYHSWSTSLNTNPPNIENSRLNQSHFDKIRYHIVNYETNETCIVSKAIIHTGTLRRRNHAA